MRRVIAQDCVFVAAIGCLALSCSYPETGGVNSSGSNEIHSKSECDRHESICKLEDQILAAVIKHFIADRKITTGITTEELYLQLDSDPGTPVQNAEKEPVLSEVPASLIEEFKRVNRRPRTWQPPSNIGLQIVSVIREGGNLLIDQTTGQGTHKAEPSPGTFIRVSRPAINDDRDTALIYYDTSFSALTGWGSAIMMKNSKNMWNIHKVLFTMAH